MTSKHTENENSEWIKFQLKYLPIVYHKYLKDTWLQAYLRETRVRESNHQKDNDMNEGIPKNKHKPGTGGSGDMPGEGSYSMEAPTSLDEARCQIVILQHRLEYVEKRLDALERDVSRLNKKD